MFKMTKAGVWKQDTNGYHFQPHADISAHETIIIEPERELEIRQQV